MTSGLLHGGVAGYWGERTSNLDWCEQNYVLTQYIAEFWNTISNVGYMIAGVYGCLWQAGPWRLERRFMLTWMSFALVGVGSASFHGSLKYTFQLLDELPMLLSVALMWYCTLRTERMSHTVYVASQVAMTVYLLLITAIYVYTDEALVHQIGYAAIIVLFIGNALRTPANLPYAPRQLYKLGAMGTVGLLSAFAVWNVDNVWCESLRAVREWVIVDLHAEHGMPVDTWSAWLLNTAVLVLTTCVSAIFQLHSWWHWLTGWSGFVGIQALAWRRMWMLAAQQGRSVDVRLHWRLLVFPVLYVVDTDVVTFRRISPRKLKLKDGDNQEKLGRKKKEYDVDDSEDDLSAATAMDAGLSTPTRRSKRATAAR